jgi:acyl-CoA thioester hydrolase
MSAAAPFVHRIRVRYQECDMQKVVFNAHYLAYCDETSAAWLGEEFGWTGADDDFDWMLVRAEVDWSGSATYGDVITMTAAVEHWGTTSFRVRYEGGVDERPVFRAVITYVCVQPGTTTKMPVPDDVKARLAFVGDTPA